jgi:two-component system, OmpR family, response regulator PhoP
LDDDGWTLAAPDGRRIALTTQERQFIGVLIAEGGRPVKRDALVLALGGDPYDYDLHRLDTLVSRLRKKADALGLDLPLRAVRGVGYLFNA